MIKNIFKQKNKGFTHTPTLALLHSFLNIFSKKFKIFSYKQSKEVNERCNKKTMPKLVSGFTLVETLIAISIFSVSIVALMTILSEGISGTGYAKNKIIAGYLAQEGIEYMRNMRDNYILYTDVSPSLTWNAFVTKVSSCGAVESCGFDNTVFTPDVFLCTSHPNSCKLYINNGNYNTNSSGADSGFSRTIQVTRDLAYPNEVKVISTVTWNHGAGGKIVFTENLFNWVE